MYGVSCIEVSVLFSEPKIPQLDRACTRLVIRYEFQCSSASRKFLNAGGVHWRVHARLEFQCSSASRKFLNIRWRQRTTSNQKFQCSSASRKFLKGQKSRSCLCDRGFQCSSASRKFLNRRMGTRRGMRRQPVSVLFSEPKIPQPTRRERRDRVAAQRFSALQRAENSSTAPGRGAASPHRPFQCSSASRKFLNCCNLCN